MIGPVHADLEQGDVGQHAADQQPDQAEEACACIAVVAALGGDKRLFAVVVLISAIRSAAAETGAHAPSPIYSNSSACVPARMKTTNPCLVVSSSL